MIRILIATSALACLLVGCTPSAAPETTAEEGRAPLRAGQPLNSLELASRIAKVRAAAVLGDEGSVRREMEVMQDDFRRSIKLPDGARPIDAERARVAARRVDGVHSVVWIDRQNLLALVNENVHRTMATIDAVCRELEPLGDTLAVVVHLQSRTARTGDELETINRNCQLDEGDRAMAQSKRELDVIPKSVRAEHASQQRRDEEVRETRRRADEAARLIEASTPEM